MAEQGAGKRKGNPNWVKGGPSPNPSGGRKDGGGSRPAPGIPASLALMGRMDGWHNFLTGAGMWNRDKTVRSEFTPDVVDSETALQIWRGDPIGARIVETLPTEALRQGFEVIIGEQETPETYKPPPQLGPAGDAAGAKQATQIGGGKIPPNLKGRADGIAWLKRKHPSAFERRYRAAITNARRDAGDAKPLQEAVTKKLQMLHLDALLREVMCYERAGGGGALFLGANDYTTDLREPLDLKKVRSLDWITPLEARELIPLYWYNNPRAPKFGQPAIYQLVPYVVGASIDGNYAPAITEIHESRLIIFPGTRVSRRVMQTATVGWGDSVLTRVVAALRAFNDTRKSAQALLSDFAQAIWKVKNLTEILAQQGTESTPSGAQAFNARMTAVDMARSVLRAMVLDADSEDFERKATPMSGFAETVDRVDLWLAAAADMPFTLLMGQAPAGMDATGASDIRFWYDRCSSVQMLRVAPAIDRVVEIELAALGEDPSTIARSVKFKPLWQPTELEVAQARYAQAQADAIYLDRDVASPEEIALSRFGGAEYSFETHIDHEARASMEAVIPPPVDAKPAKQLPAISSDPFGSLPGVGELPAAAETPEDKPDEPTFKVDFSPDQERDENGRFAAGGGASSNAPAHAEHASAKANAASARAEGAPSAASHGTAASAHRNAKTAHEIAGNEHRAASHEHMAEHHQGEADKHKAGGEHGHGGHEGHEHGEHEGGLLELGKAVGGAVVGEETAKGIEGKD